jgi:hypothetical protein
MRLKHEDKALYLTDMSRALPADKPAALETADYTTSNLCAPVPGAQFQWSPAVMKPDVRSPRARFTGKAVFLRPTAAGQELAYTLPAKGWHAIFFGLAQGPVRVKLSTDPAFHTFGKGGPDWKGYEEALFGIRKLAGEELVFATDAKGSRAVVAYIKLVPLAADEVRRETRSFPPAKRNLTATDDGHCITAGSVNRRELVRDIFEPFRDSPFGLLYWGIPFSGTALGYAEALRSGKPFPAADVKEGQDRTIREFYATGEDPLACVVDCARDVGMKVHFYQRPGNFYYGRAFPSFSDGAAVPFYLEHPEWHLRHKDGSPLLGRMSIVFPEVRRYLTEVLRDSLEHVPAGVNLCFVRGAPLVAYEPGAVEEFEAQYHADPRKLRKDDARFLDFRCACTTRWVREVRQMLDEEGRKRKTTFELSAVVFGDEKTNRFVGLDPETWAREGLVDIVNPYFSPADWLGWLRRELDLTCFKPLRRYPVQVVPFASHNVLEEGDVVLRRARALYAAGYKGFASWDTICYRVNWRSRFWQTLKKLGDPKRLDEIVPGEWLPRIGYFSQFDGYGWDKDNPFGAC